MRIVIAGAEDGMGVGVDEYRGDRPVAVVGDEELVLAAAVGAAYRIRKAGGDGRGCGNRHDESPLNAGK